MSVRRVMGIETEYGISVPGDPAANPMVLSGHVVNAYASAHGVRSGRASWDYADEAPLRDARGFEISRALADPGQLTDVEDPTLANVVLTNGARLYVDHAHPEYSSPEVTNPRDAVKWDRAGELIMLEAVRRLQDRPGLPGVNLYKNNTDGKGASYGTHENYLMRRETPFADIVRHLVPFFVVRQVITGSGRVGIGQDSRTPGFQLSQRADFFEVEVGPGDDAEAADHQHPRRAARRRRPLPPAPRHHRRRQPLRRRQPAQARHDEPGARPHRGPGDDQGPHAGQAGGDAAPDLPRPDAAGQGDAARRCPDDGAGAAVGVPRRRRRLPGRPRRGRPTTRIPPR